MRAELGIVIPLREHISNFESFLKEIALVLIKNSINSEITIVAVEESYHLSAAQYEILSKKYMLNLKCFTLKNNSTGYGRVIRSGISQSDSRYVVVIPPDGTAEVNLIPDLLLSCRNGSSLTIINRYSISTKLSKFNIPYLSQSLFRIATGIFIGKKLPQDSTFANRMFLKSSFEYLAISGNSWDMFAEHTIKTLLAGDKVCNLNGTNRIPSSRLKFSYARNSWSYLRIVVRGTLHRLGLPWF